MVFLLETDNLPCALWDRDIDIEFAYRALKLSILFRLECIEEFMTRERLRCLNEFKRIRIRPEYVEESCNNLGDVDECWNTCKEKIETLMPPPL